MAGKHLRAMSNSKQNKFLKEENSILLNLGFRFDSEATVDNDELYETAVLQGVLFVLTSRTNDVINRFSETQLDHLEHIGIIDTSTVKNLVQMGEVTKAYTKFMDNFSRKYPYLWYETFSIFTKTMTVLYEYFNFYEWSLKNSLGVSLCERLLIFCYLTVIDYTILRHCKGLSKDEVDTFNKNIASKNDNLINKSARTHPLLPEYIHYDCDESLKEDFCKIYNITRENWHFDSTDEEKLKRNSFDNLKSLDLKNDWSLLFEILNKNFYDKSKSNMRLNELKAFQLSKNISLKINDDEACSQSWAFLYSLTNQTYFNFEISFLHDYFNDYMKRCLFEKFKSLDAEKADLLTQMKELKSTNRSLTRDMGKLNTENESLKQEQLKNQELLEQVRHSEEESQELIELRSEVEKLKSEKEDLSVALAKSENKNSWSETKIKELEGELHYFDGVEQSLMTLQNENNVLLADIERIEGLEEQEDDSDFERKLDAIRNEHIMFIGGTGDMLQKYVELFPNSDNINISDNNPNFTIPSRFKYVVIYTKVVKHCFCDRAESLVGKEHIIYLNILNKNLVIDELYKSIVGHKNKI